MTDDLKERLLELCNGHPNATIPWPHRVIHDALAYITDLEARLAAAEGKLTEWRSSQSYRYIGRDGKPVLARDLEARAEAAEAGKDALAEALRERDGGVHGEDCRSHRLNMGMFAQSCNCGHEDALAALAAYEARREK